MSTHNKCFYGEIRKIIPELSPDTPPSQVLVMSSRYDFSNVDRDVKHQIIILLFLNFLHFNPL